MDLSLPQTSFLVSDQSATLPPSSSSEAEHKHVNGINVGSDSENDGFISGEDEELETEPTMPVLVYPPGKHALDDPFVDSGETQRPVAKVTMDDDDDDDDDEDEDNRFVDGEDDSNGVVLEQGGGDGDGKEQLDEPVKEGDFSDTHEVFVEASGVGDEGFESGDFEGVSAMKNDEEEIVNEESDEVLHDRQQVDDGNDHLESSVVVNDDDVKFTSGEESLVDTLNANLLGSGVAVVGDKVEVDESEIKGVEAPACNVSLDNGFDPIEQVSEGVFDKVADGDAESGQNVDTGTHDDTGHVQKSDIAPLEKGGEGVFDKVVDRDAESGQNVGTGVDDDSVHVQKSDIAPLEKGAEDVIDKFVDGDAESGQNVDTGVDDDGVHGRKSDIAPLEGENGSHIEASGEGNEEEHHYGDREIDGSVSDKKGEGMIFGSSDAANKFLEDLEHQLGAGESSRDERIDGQIVTDSDEEVETDDEGDSKEMFDTATLAALLKAASGAGQDGSSITVTSEDGSRLFSLERPAGLGPSHLSGKPPGRSIRPNLFTPSISRAGTNSDSNLSEEEKKKLEKLQQIRIKFLRLVQRLGFTPEESIAAQVLYRLTLVAGRQTGQIFSLDAAKESASKLEAEGRDDLNYSINILVLGKTGVGKSATINSIFGETRTSFSAYGPATTAVTEIVGMVDGVKIRIFDTPGLKSSAMEQSFNRKVLSTVKKLTKKSPPDIVLYVDRLDLQTRDLNDLPMLRSITSALGPSIWRNVIVTLTHAASAPPDGPSGTPLSYDVFVAQRSHIVQQTIGQAVGDLRLMNPSLMNPVSLVENHPSCRKNRDGLKVLPNGQSWRPLLLLLCYSMKILSEAGNLSKTQESFDQRRLFGFRTRSPPLPYLLSWLLQSRAHPKLPADQGGVDNGDSDIEMADLSDSDLDEDEDEYDQLPPFKPLKKSQIAKLNREQQKAYFEEYDYRVKLLQKKQWREELRRMREKKKGNTKVSDYDYMEEDEQENGSPAAVPVPLPDMALPPSFDSDNPAYRYRFLEPTSQLLTRPVLDTHSWDHDCGYDGVNIENSLAIINQFPAAVTVQITKDKKDFSIHLDSSVAAKHGDNGSTMAGFDIQNIGKQVAYIVRGETKFKNFKRNKTAAGVSVTFLGENVSTGLKVEDQIALGKRLVLVGSTGTVRSQGDSAYGANVEVRLREADFPVGQDQSSLSLSLVKWRGDLALGANLQSQFSIGRSFKMAVRAGLNNKLSGQITVRTSSSDQLQIALIAILPIARTIYKNFWPGASENYSIY
ncbi:translocase of chloroplast 159, chloroplastic-like [Gastrolobium bilobum]|uniref:translocase of chloroplast 159, chloroplastic-like n=1 Tax=Gastrolobium bilobum TaxID=150636 RepID=UPI002AAFE825|nr:translocase of chloroplast 159, chloroplastic-like [Gastrolobium bilobum]